MSRSRVGQVLRWQNASDSQFWKVQLSVSICAILVRSEEQGVLAYSPLLLSHSPVLSVALVTWILMALGAVFCFFSPHKIRTGHRVLLAREHHPSYRVVGMQSGRLPVGSLCRPGTACQSSVVLGKGLRTD